jgi:hypothetical protein
MTLHEVFKAEGIPEEFAAAVRVAKFAGRRRTSQASDWTKSADGSGMPKDGSLSPRSPNSVIYKVPSSLWGEKDQQHIIRTLPKASASCRRHYRSAVLSGET